jgi:hypothetical protein
LALDNSVIVVWEEKGHIIEENIAQFFLIEKKKI